MLLAHTIKEAENSYLHYIIVFMSVTNKAVRKITKERGWIEIEEVSPSSKVMNRHSKIFMIRLL
jgi:hypothetical protein